jgi:hypothetical protein
LWDRVAYEAGGAVPLLIAAGVMGVSGGRGGLLRAAITASAGQGSHRGDYSCSDDQQRCYGKEALPAQLAAAVLAAASALGPLTSLNPFV